MAQRFRFLFLIATSATYGALAQCSDAGACSLARQTADPSGELSLTYQFGRSSKADDLTFHTLQLDVTVQLFEQSRLSMLLPLNQQSGPLGSVFGVGDALIIWSQTVLANSPLRLGFQIGGKFSTAASNAGNLPQAYQSGLGTNDVLLGATAEYLRWSFLMAYQFSQERSANKIDRLKRGDDLLLKAGYSEALGYLRLGVEVLVIKRLHESSVLVSAPGGLEVFGTVAGSDQTQVNLLGRVGFPVLERSELQGMAAVPLLRRSINLDGLTRSLSLSLTLAYLLE